MTITGWPKTSLRGEPLGKAWMRRSREIEMMGVFGRRQLPDPGVTIQRGKTALVIADPQNDFLSPNGVTWGVVGESVTENGTVANIESLLKTAKANDLPVFVSPHYYYPTDHGWHFEGLWRS